METLETNLFIISQQKHIIFACVAAVFFLLQFVRTKRLYQLILAIAIPASLLIYIAPENKTFFYGVGIAEAVMLLAAFIASTVRAHKDAKQKKAEEQAAKAAAGTEA